MTALLWKSPLPARLALRPGAAGAALLARPAQAARPRIAATVAGILAAVRRGGDDALRRLTRRFDGARLTSLRVTPEEFAAAAAQLTRADHAALRTAHRNLRRFHAAQRPAPLRVTTTPGVVCEKLPRPIDRVGLYVPGGSAPLFSTALMLGVPSQLARNPSRVLCTPCDPGGRVNPWILCAAHLCGLTEVFKVGGAQAIAALAYGTASIPKCDKLFGPGNAYVTEAKLQVSRDPAGAALDLPAGPSEVMVVADDGANPAFVAADLLSQAEHGPDSQVVLVTFSRPFAARVESALAAQLADLPRAAVARRALAGSRAFVAATAAEAIALANRYAPEHLILQVAAPRRYLAGLTNAGSVFLGPWTPESLGDYASGTNHVLPTYGWARACSGLGLADFLRTMTVQTATPRGLRRLGPVVERLALAEHLAAHQRAVRIRLDRLAP